MQLKDKWQLKLDDAFLFMFTIFIFYVCILKVLLELKYNHSIDRLNIINILKYLPSDIVHKVTKRYIAIIR